MTELDTLRRARMYLEKLAQGIDPITGQDVAETDTARNPRISRCFTYVCGVLDNEIHREQRREERKLPPFCLTVQEISRLRPLDRAARISELIAHIQAQVGGGRMKKLPSTAVTSWLTELGMLEVQEGSRGRRPTARGVSMGITTETRAGGIGEYTAVVYTPAAQQFILDNLPAVLQRAASGKSEVM